MHFLITDEKLTFISTLSLNFSLLIILIATFLPVTQCTPNLTKPVKIQLAFEYTFVVLFSKKKIKSHNITFWRAVLLINF